MITQSEHHVHPVTPRAVADESARMLRLALDQWTRREVARPLAVIAILSVGMAWNVGSGVAAAARRGSHETLRMLADPGVLLLTWTKVGIAGILALLVCSITRPHDTGVAQAERLAVPRGWQWLLSRWAAAALTVGLGTLLVAPTTWQVAHRAGVPQGVDASRLAMAGRLTLGLVLVTVLVAGVAALVRSSAVALSLLGLWYLLGEEILSAMPGFGWLAQLLPLANLWHFVGFELSNTAVPAWSPAVSGGLLAATALGAGAAGLWRSAR